MLLLKKPRFGNLKLQKHPILGVRVEPERPLTIYNRVIYQDFLNSSENYFVFGPRQTGKTTFLRTSLPKALYVDLLNSGVFFAMANNPSSLSDFIAAHNSNKSPDEPLTVIIDEVQKLPALLDAVQEAMFRYRKCRFILTGSSPRKLRKAGTNLLGGRASWLNFHGITSQEIKTWKNESWKNILQYGSLPNILMTESPAMAKRKWRSYLDLYLKEEIMQEGLVRNFPAFSKFLTVAGFTSGTQIVFEKVGSDNEIKGKTIRSWYEVLDDTLVGQLLPCFNGTHLRKAVSTSKFYFFDVGLAFYLKGQNFPIEGTPQWGEALEHFIYCEIKAYLDVFQKTETLSYWRTQTGIEVDFIVAENDAPKMAIEVKAKISPSGRDFSGLIAIKEEFRDLKCVVVCQTALETQKDDGICLIPVAVFLEKLWSGALV